MTGDELERWTSTATLAKDRGICSYKTPTVRAKVCVSYASQYKTWSIIGFVHYYRCEVDSNMSVMFAPILSVKW